MPIGALISTISPLAIGAASVGIPLAMGMSRYNHTKLARYSRALDCRIPNPYMALATAAVVGASLIIPTLFSGKKQKPTENYEVGNDRNKWGLALVAGQVVLFGVLSKYIRPLHKLHLADPKGRFSSFAIVGPLAMGLGIELLNQSVAKGKPVKELDILPASVFSSISCFYGLMGRNIGPLIQGGRFASEAYAWNRPQAWVRTGIINGATTSFAIFFQYFYAKANGNDHAESLAIAAELTALNLIAGTLNERFLFRNFLDPGSMMATVARQLIIGGVFAVYFKWWKGDGINQETPIDSQRAV